MEQQKIPLASDAMIKIIRAAIQLMQKEAKKGHGPVKKRKRNDENKKKY